MSRPTRDTSRRSRNFTYGAFTLFGRTFQTVPLSLELPYRGPTTPSRKRDGLGCSAFARHYLRNHSCFLFLGVLRCFTSPGIALKPYFIQTPATPHYQRRVSPFGYLRIKACLPLPEAYRSLPRPSSPSDAKASIVCPFTLNHKSGIPLGNSVQQSQTVRRPKTMLHRARVACPSLCNCQRTNIHPPLTRGFRDET